MTNVADWLLYNARIWTGEAELPWAQALAVRGERIVAVGADEEVKKLAGENTTCVDAGGKLVLPGFIDNHTHFLIGGFQLLSLDLRAVSCKKEFIAAVRQRAAQLPVGAVLGGGGWSNDQWAQTDLPHRSWVDSFTLERPVFLHRSDLHIAFANSAALRLAGIDKNTPDPVGGQILRDEDSGEPTGILKDNAVKLLQEKLPAPSPEEYDQALQAAMDCALRSGVTSVQDVTAWRDWLDWECMLRFQKKQALSVRIYARTQIHEWEKQPQLRQSGFVDDVWLRLGGIKGFVDGSLGSGTAYMCEPYDDAPETCGLLTEQMLPEGIMKERLAASDRAGLAASLHAIGDKANQLLLDIFEEVEAENGPRDRRFRIEHAQHLRREDIGRMARLGVLASVQPGHVADDGCWAEKRIGEKRCRMTYAFRSLLEAGVPLSFGTDWPVVPLDPFQGIYTAVTRQTLDGKHPGGWVPEEKLTLEDALRAYTLGGAYAEFSEQEKGSLKVGKLADLVMVSQDIFQVPVDDLPKTKVLLTMVGGQVRYCAEE